MARLTYSVIMSLDGYHSDRDGRFDWATPDEEVHAFVNERERSVGTYLYGRRLYETMRIWQSYGDDPGEPPVVQEYARIWRAAEKIVFSTTLRVPTTPRTAIRPTFSPDAVRALKDTARADLGIGGPALAAEALRAGLVDECLFLVAPVTVGGGRPALPLGLRLGLTLIAERRFASGFLALDYAVAPTTHGPTST